MHTKTATGLLFALAAGNASADFAGNLIQINATNASGDYSWHIAADDDRITYDGDAIRFNFDGGEDGAIVVDDGQDGIAFELRSLNIEISAPTSSRGIAGEQRVNVGFDLVAGSQNSTFTVDSAFLSFATIQNASAQASASVSVSDLGSGSASISPVGASIFRAQINGQVPGGSDVANLLTNSVNANGFFATESANDDFGAGGFVALGQDVSSISSRFEFSLSAGDLGSGTGTFVVIPAPASVALLGLGGFAMIRRR